MITNADADEYMRVVGFADNETWEDETIIRVLAWAAATELITGFDWESEVGEKVKEKIDSVWPQYVQWRDNVLTQIEGM